MEINIFELILWLDLERRRMIGRCERDYYIIGRAQHLVSLSFLDLLSLFFFLRFIFFFFSCA